MSEKTVEIDGVEYQLADLRMPELELTVLAKDEARQVALVGDGKGELRIVTLEMLEDAVGIEQQEPRRVHTTRVRAVADGDEASEVDLVPPLRRFDDGTPREGVIEHGAVSFDLLTCQAAGMRARARLYARHWYVEVPKE